MLLKNAKAFMDGRFVPDTDVLIKNGVIAAIGSGLTSDGEQVLDLNGDILLPGFVDVHIHAFMGMDTMYGEQAVRHMSRELRKHGVAAFLPTTMSASPQDTLNALRGIRAAMERPEPDGAEVLGAHMEGPFLNPDKAGAQPRQFLTAPTDESWRACVGDCESIVRMVTLAPELTNALPFIRFLSSRGIVASIGHTAATGALVHQAADNGACHVTHTFNAQTPLNHREPGVPGAALVDDRLDCEVISDGIHLHPDIVSLLMRAKGAAHTVAITDAMEAAGMPDGQYQLGGQDVYVKDGAARLVDGTLAGSTLTMHRAFENLVRFGATPEAAAAMVTQTPARSINAPDKGVLKPGARAVLARYDAEYRFVSAL